MNKAAKGADVLIKIDCDTMILKSDWIDALEDNPQAVFSSFYNPLSRLNYGLCYAVRGALMKRLKNDVCKNPPSGHCFEDGEMGRRISRLCGDRADHVLYWKRNKVDGFWICDPHEIDGSPLEMQVVSCGCSWSCIKAVDRGRYKESQFLAMAKVNKGMEEEDPPR